MPSRLKTIRRRTPTVLQMEAVECGAACLAMILGRLGRHVSLEDLRYECGVSRDGTKASNILLAARKYGLIARGYSVEDPADLRAMLLPMIVYWNFNHFIVVEGFGRDGVYLNDPATGPRIVSDEEFDQSFTGIVLTFEPGQSFLPAGQRPSLWKGLERRLRNSRGAFIFVVLASVALVVPGLLAPSVSRVLVDYYLIKGFNDWLPPLLAGMVAIALFRVVVTWLQKHYLLRLQTKLAIGGGASFLWHVLRLPIGFFAQRYGGEVANRMLLNDRVALLIAGDLATAMFNVATMLLYAAIMVQYDLMLTGVAVSFAAVNIVAFALVSRKLSDGAQRLLVDQGKMQGLAMQGLQMIESYKASGTEGLFFARWAGYHAKVINSEQSLARSRLALGTTPILLSMVGSSTILVLGGFEVMNGTLTIGALVAFQALMASFTAPVIGLVNLGSQMLEAHGEIIRLDDIMTHQIDEEFTRPATSDGLPAHRGILRSDGADGVAPLRARRSATAIAAAAPATQQLNTITPVKLSGQVEMLDVSFGFNPSDPPLIQGFTLSLAPGARIALVGRSGSGKSTIGKLIAGLYRPNGGEIRFDGIAMADLPRRVLRNSLAMVDQDIALLEGTITENISLWDPTMPQDRIVRAARDAAIHEDISQRAEAYAFMVKEGGRNFSGGQRQRIEIARALATNPSVLILDEATSALDVMAEKQVMDNVRRRGCSCIIIAHRLSTIRDCDEIIVLDRGKVIERGTHAQLVASDGCYRELIES